MILKDVPNILSAVPMPLVLIGSNEHILMINQAAEEIFGNRLLGQPYFALLRQPEVLAGVEKAMQLQEVQTVRYFTTAGSKETTYRVMARPVNLESGAAVMLSFEDITHVEEAGAMRRDFVANVSHELRTPLTALIGFIDTLRGPARNDEGARDRFLGIMEKEAKRMTRLVRDLLSLSRVESEERMRPATEIDLQGCLGSAIQALRFVATENDVILNHIQSQSPIYVQGDSDQLQQLFTNLIENAVKYGGRNKTVTISSKMHSHDPVLRGPAVTISIKDEGPGIDPIHTPRLTERFYRIDNHRSREMGGTGLGLAIVKHIVGRHRGRLKIHSTLGQGSVFSVLLPIESK
ncbi:MAG: ATP-binding protein [Pseudoruegeria sp.]